MAAVFDAGQIEATLELNRGDFLAGLALAKEEAQAFKEWMAEPVSFGVSAQAGFAELEAEALRNSLEQSLGAIDADIALDPGGTLEGAVFARDQIEAAIGTIDVPVRIDTSSLSALALGLQRSLEQALGGAVGGSLLDASGGGDGGGGGGNFLTNLFGGGAAVLLAWVHGLHLVMPEIIGFISAVGAAAIGMVALGIASIGAATDIMTGFQAVSAAQNAIQAAIPGTTQWQTAVVSLGQAWSAIPAALQPAVNSINLLMQGFGNTPMAQELQGFLGAQAGDLLNFASNGAGVFAPLILATQQAVDTIEGMFAKLAGSGALAAFVDSVARMVGPAMVELAQLAGSMLQFGAGFAKAIQAGAGMEMLVNLFRTLATIVNSSLFQGFITGWVSFDRLISTALGLVVEAIGYFANLGVNMRGVGNVLGFVVSGFTAVMSAFFLVGRASGGLSLGLMGVRTSLMGILGQVAAIGLITVAINGLVGGVAELLHTSNPLSAVWNFLGSAIDHVSQAAGQSISTINGYRLQLQGAIPITANFTAAVDLLVRSEQSIGSSLVSAATGFATFTVAATQSVSQIIGNLAQQNVSLAQWAADAQILIRRGMDPSAVAAMAQQAPQDLASMLTARTAQLQQLSVQWNEKFLLASMSGQNGTNALTQAVLQGLQSGTPSMVAAAEAVAKELGIALNTPFDPSNGPTGGAGGLSAAIHSHQTLASAAVASVQSIATTMNQLPTKVIAELAGQLQKFSATTLEAATAIKALHPAAQSTLSVLESMGTNLLMLGVGLRLLNIGLLITETRTLAVGIATRVAAAATAVWAGITKLATAAQWLWNVAMDANPIMLIILGLAALGVAAYLLVTHWRQVSAWLGGIWKDIVSMAQAAWDSITTAIHNFLNPIFGFFNSVFGPQGTLEHVLSTVEAMFEKPFAAAFNMIVGWYNDTLGHIFGDMHTISVGVQTSGSASGGPGPSGGAGGSGIRGLGSNVTNASVVAAVQDLHSTVRSLPTQLLMAQRRV